MGPIGLFIALSVARIQVDADSCNSSAGQSLFQSHRALHRIDGTSPADSVELVSETNTDWLAGDRLRAGSCDALDKAECRAHTGCGWSETGNLCHIRVAWVHIMKTGGSFGTTLAHYANSSLPKTAHMPSGNNQSDPEDRTTEGSQGEENFFVYKYPYTTWFQDVFWHGDKNPANHVPLDTRPEGSYSQWKGNIFGIFRKPERRTLSAFYHFMNGDGDLLEFANETYGQQASIMSMGAEAKYKLFCEFRKEEFCPLAKATKPNVRLAIERLKGFAFVGLLEEYDLSVCLFHRMFKGECLPVEFINMRPHLKASRESKEKKAQDLALLEHNKDPFDGPFYDAAARIFWANVKKYDVRRSTCLETCRSAAHIFGSSEATDHQNSSGLSLLSVAVATDMEYDWPDRYVLDD